MTFAAAFSCLWPGLPQLWRDGHWRGLATAVGFAAWLNILLLSTFLWVEWLPPWLRAAGWLLLGVFWAGAAWAAWHDARQRAEAGGEDVEDLLITAQTEYLKGHWFEAESLLRRVSNRPGGDPDATLMLAKVFRRQGRCEESRALLDRVERFEGAGRWRIEVAKERRLQQQLPEKGSNHPCTSDLPTGPAR